MNDGCSASCTFGACVGAPLTLTWCNGHVRSREQPRYLPKQTEGSKPEATAPHLTHKRLGLVENDRTGLSALSNDALRKYHSSTWSARTKSDGGASRPIA